MALLDRMVLREILVPLGVGMLAILQLLVILQLLQLNQVVFGSAITLGDLGHLTLALAPHFLVVAVPLAFMLGVQLGIGRLAADRELIALTAAGIHPLRLFRIPIALACALALVVIGLTRWAEPWGVLELNRLLNGVIKRNLQSGVAPGVFNDNLPRFMVYVGGQNAEGRWNGVLIEDDVGDGSPLLALAASGRVEDAGGAALVLRLFDGEIHRSEPRGETVARFEEGSFLVGVQEPVARQNKFFTSAVQLPDSVLRERIAQLERAGSGDDRDKAAKYRLEIVRRWAVPFACLAFALLGVPLATGGRGGKSWAYLVTLSAFVMFYALSSVAVALTKAGWNEWVAGLIPNAVVLAAGLSFTFRMVTRGISKPE